MCDQCLADYQELPPEMVAFFVERKDQIEALGTDFAKLLNTLNMGIIPQEVTVVDADGPNQGEMPSKLEDQSEDVQAIVKETVLWMNQFHALTYLIGFWTSHQYQGEGAVGRFSRTSMEQAFHACVSTVRSGLHDGMSYGYAMSLGTKRKGLN